MTGSGKPDNPPPPRHMPNMVANLVANDATSDMQVFDRRIHRLRRMRAAGIFAEHDFLLTEVAEQLTDRLQDINRHFPLALDLGTHTGILTRSLLSTGKASRVIATDFAHNFIRDVAGKTPHINSDTIAVETDEEALPFAAQSFDLITSALSLHWVNDLPGALFQIRNCLKPDGLFMAAILGGETLKELRDAFLEAEVAIEGGVSPRVSPFTDVRLAGGLLQRAGFALPVVDVDTITVTYTDAFALMRDLQGMGETNVHLERRRGFTRRRTLVAMAEAYHARHAFPDGRIPATFQIIYLTGWAPHDSQQKPLRPGSAKMRLADALGVRENKL